jgi:hypothetical protein
MDLVIGSVVINCSDRELMAQFWTQALGLRPGPVTESGRFQVLAGDTVNLSLQVAQSTVRARDQMHLDLYSGDQPADVARLQSIGARLIRRHHDPDDDYVVLSDPEGNQFCVCAVPPRNQPDEADG